MDPAQNQLTSPVNNSSKFGAAQFISVFSISLVLFPVLHFLNIITLPSLKSKTNIQEKQVAQNLTPSSVLSPQLSLPIPLDDKSVKGISVFYTFEGRIENIENNPVDPNKKLFSLLSDYGYRFPQKVSISNNMPINSSKNPDSPTTIAASSLKKQDEVVIDIAYQLNTKELRVISIRLKSPLK